MGRAAEPIPGLCYNLNHVEDGRKFCVQAQGCPAGSDSIRFRLLPSGGYLRICEDGRADTKGGGGGMCHFKLVVHESGLLQLSRGKYFLSVESGDITSVCASDDCVSPAKLWSIEKNESPEGPPLLATFLCQGALKFGPFQREDLKDGVIRLQTSDSRYLRIVPQNGIVDAAGGGGPPCQFKMLVTDGNHFMLRSEHEPFCLLGTTPWGALCGQSTSVETNVFSWESIEQPLGTPLAQPSLVGKQDFDVTVDLTPQQRKCFMEDGFIIVKGAVSPLLASAALAEINHSLLKPGAATADEEGNVSFCADIAGSQIIRALLYGSPLWTLAQRLMGRGCVGNVAQGQIALRPPALGVAGIDGDESIPPKQWHIDGMLKPEIQNSGFSLLVGVALSDQQRPNSGNLIAFKGSHRILQPIVRQEAEAPGSYPFLNHKGDDGGKPALSGGQQILLGVGDAVLLHQKVAHRIGINCSPNIRYQTYFRLKHIDHAAHLTDGSVHHGLWRQFGGLEAGGCINDEPPQRHMTAA